MINLKPRVSKILTLAAVTLFLLVSIHSPEVDGDNSTSDVLFDLGNGNTEWLTAAHGATYRDVLKNTALSNGIPYDDSGSLTVYGIGETVIGGVDNGGSLFTSGTTGKKSTSLWTAYRWHSGAWEKIVDLNDAHGSEHLALAFYPEGCIPPETPDRRGSWTMYRGNSAQDGHQDGVKIGNGDAKVEWEFTRGGMSGVYAGVLHVGNYVFAKFGADKNLDGALICYELDGSNNPETMKRWEFNFEGQLGYETATPVIVGQYIFVQTSDGLIHRIPWEAGPGVDDANVKTLSEKIPQATGAPVEGAKFGPGIGSMVYDTGCLYFLANNGMVYCFDIDLEHIWSRQMGGHNYYVSPTIYDDYVFTGAKDGCLYIMDKKTGKNFLDEPEEVFVQNISGKKFGNVSAPAVFKDGDVYTLMFTVSDGMGMSCKVGGLAIYEFNPNSSELTKKYLDTEDYGPISTYVLPLDVQGFKGVIVVATKGVFKIDTEGNKVLLNESLYSVKAPPLLVNGKSVYMASYAPSKPLYEMDFNGNILSMWVPDVVNKNYCMSSPIFVEGTLIFPSDTTLAGIGGTFPEYVPPEPVQEMPVWMKSLITLLAIIAILTMVYVVMRFGKGIEKPFAHISERISYYLKSDEPGHNVRSKRRLFTVLIAGIVLTLALFLTCLCVGPTATFSLPEMLSSLKSAVSKGGKMLSYNELMVYESRLPRTMAALAVGIGLSIAGSVYQAIIRNPLVDPYIMGVSAGAGTAAVAVIAFNFTFFGLFAPHSIYVTAFAAIVGGIAAFAATMFIAEKAGGSSLNYVLAGVIIGLAFSAIQTLMLSFAGHRVSNALSWLFGSFANVTWNQVWLIVAPALTLAIAPLLWAKELNLVLLGEDQAQQMGLDVRNFNRWMLILASVLTSICVAFVGIIGFVGLVVPHLCRMMLGGDHRLVLPASIVFGGALMMAADLVARMAYAGLELPVGAITTIIGVPVFAYLLIKRGNLYEG